MRYWVCFIAGLVIFAGSVYAFSGALSDLLETGTCGSGNTPYVIAKQCPEGTGADILTLIGSILGLFAAMAVLAFRGDRPGGGGGRGVSPFLAGWAIFFSVTGAASLFHSLTSESIPADGKAGGIIVGATFLLMGLPVLVFWAWTVFSDLAGRDERPAGFAGAIGLGAPASARVSTAAPDIAAPPASGVGGDRIGELERLDRLRRSGALTDAEFEREKARLLGRRP